MPLRPLVSALLVATFMPATSGCAPIASNADAGTDGDTDAGPEPALWNSDGVPAPVADDDPFFTPYGIGVSSQIAFMGDGLVAASVSYTSHLLFGDTELAGNVTDTTDYPYDSAGALLVFASADGSLVKSVVIGSDNDEDYVQMIATSAANGNACSVGYIYSVSSTADLAVSVDGQRSNDLSINAISLRYSVGFLVCIGPDLIPRVNVLADGGVFPTAVSLAPSGDAFVTGRMLPSSDFPVTFNTQPAETAFAPQGFAKSADFFLARYNANGNPVWAIRDASQDGDNIVSSVQGDAVAYDESSDTTFVAGSYEDIELHLGTEVLPSRCQDRDYFGSNINCRDSFLAQISATGAVLSVEAFGGGHGVTSIVALGVSADGFVGVGGSFANGATLANQSLASLNPDRDGEAFFVVMNQDKDVQATFRPYSKSGALNCDTAGVGAISSIARFPGGFVLAGRLSGHLNVALSCNGNDEPHDAGDVDFGDPALGGSGVSLQDTGEGLVATVALASPFPMRQLQRTRIDGIASDGSSTLFYISGTSIWAEHIDQ